MLSRGSPLGLVSPHVGDPNRRMFAFASTGPKPGTRCGPTTYVSSRCPCLTKDNTTMIHAHLAPQDDEINVL